MADCAHDWAAETFVIRCGKAREGRFQRCTGSTVIVAAVLRQCRGTRGVPARLPALLSLVY